MKKKQIKAWCLILALAFAVLPLSAQFTLDGQIVQRAEFRNGFGKLIAHGQDHAAFIAHRARLQASYQLDSLTLYVSAQDVRTWGNAPQVKATDPLLSVHEAWAEVRLGKYWKAKLGRQELNYDNFRFLGNLDWALQGRAHDFALIKFEQGQARLHFGGGYNQDGQALSGNLFTVANQYKTAQMIRYENRAGKLDFSLLFWNDGRQYFVENDLGQITEKGVRYRQTLGLPTLRYTIGSTAFSGFLYLQFGKDAGGRKTDAYNLNLQATQEIGLGSEAGRRLRLSGGFEILSGTRVTLRGATVEQAERNSSYSPLYGTNHLFNGYMDLFFVGGAFENSAGLQDYFLRARFDAGPRLFVQADGHQFYTHASITDADSGARLSREIGTELDLSLGFVFTPSISLQGGYSQLFNASEPFARLLSVPNPRQTQNWAYLMLIFRPTMKNKFIGILL